MNFDKSVELLYSEHLFQYGEVSLISNVKVSSAK